jgi:hypothetical protein
MANCVISSSNVLDQSGSLAAHARMIITPVSVAGVVMSTRPRVVTVTNGIVSFTEYQGVTVNIKADLLGYNSTTGTNVLIPSSATSTLEALTSVAVVPTSGLTIYNEGVALTGLYGSVDFVGSLVNAVEASAGRVTVTITGSGSGTVTSFSAGDLSPLFTTSEANPTTTPALSFSLSTQVANRIFAGPATGADAAPTFRTLVAADIPDLSAVYATPASVVAYAQPLSAALTSVASGLTVFGMSLIDDADATAGRSTLGLGSIATQAASAVAITGGTAAGLTGLAIRSTGAAFDLTFASSEVLTAGKTLSFVLGDTSRTLTVGASASVSGSNTGDQTSVSGNAGTATALQNARTIGGVSFDGTANITVATATGGFTVSGGALALGANDLTMTGSLGATGARLTKGWFTDLEVTNAIAGSVTGNAATATALATGRNINGVAFDGTANITVTAAAGTLTGTVLNATVVTSSLTALGTVTSGGLGTGASLGGVTMSLGSDADGDIYYRASNVLMRLPKGTGLQQLRMNAGATAPEWATVSSSGATTALDNLASVAINTSLLPASTQSLGSATFPWLESWVGNTTQYEKVSQSAGLITHAALGSATNISIGLTPKGTGAVNATGHIIASGRIGIGTGNGTAVGDLIFRNNGGAFEAVLGDLSAFVNLKAQIINASGGAGINYRLGDAGPVLGLVSDASILNSTASLYMPLRVGNLKLFGLSTTTLDLMLERNAAGVAAVSNGTAGQWGSLLVGTRDAGTTTVTNGLTIGHQSTGTPAAGLGSAVLFNINSSTTADQAAAQLKAVWQTSTHASRVAWASLATNAVGTTTLIDRVVTGPRTTLTDGSAVSLFEIALPTLTGASGVIDVTIYATDGTDVQIRSQIIRYSSVNKAGTYVTEIAIASEAASASTGTLTAAWNILEGTNKVTIQVNANTSLAGTTSFYCSYTLHNNSDQAATIL